MAGASSMREEVGATGSSASSSCQVDGMMAAAAAGAAVPPPAPMERYIAPFIVLGLHSLLLFDVVAHRKRRLVHFETGSALPILEWFFPVATVGMYLCTVLSGPGFLAPTLGRAANQGSSGCSHLGRCCGCCCLAWFAPAAAAAAAAAAVATNGVPTLRDTARARELQPIGRARLDTVSADPEFNSDPGEETIEAGDLEEAATSAGLCIEDSLTPSGRLKLREPTVVHGNMDEEFPSDDPSQHVVLQSGHKLRYCKVCQMHQPLRTKHCWDCGRCVRTYDHHCPWIGTCVGEGNRVFFFWFLAAQFVELATFSLEGVLELVEGGINVGRWMEKYPLLVLGLFVLILFTLMVGPLLCFHSYLAVSNMTTWENISWHHISYLRSVSPEDGSPFSRSVGANLAAFCCLPWCARRRCFRGCAAASGVKRDEDGWAVWELGDPHSPWDLERLVRCECIRC